MRVMESGLMETEVVKELCKMKCGKAVGMEGLQMNSLRKGMTMLLIG